MSIQRMTSLGYAGRNRPSIVVPGNCAIVDERTEDAPYWAAEKDRWPAYLADYVCVSQERSEVVASLMPGVRLPVSGVRGRVDLARDDMKRVSLLVALFASGLLVHFAFVRRGHAGRVYGACIGITCLVAVVMVCSYVRPVSTVFRNAMASSEGGGSESHHQDLHVKPAKLQVTAHLSRAYSFVAKVAETNPSASSRIASIDVSCGCARVLGWSGDTVGEGGDVEVSIEIDGNQLGAPRKDLGVAITTVDGGVHYGDIALIRGPRMQGVVLGDPQGGSGYAYLLMVPSEYWYLLRPESLPELATTIHRRSTVLKLMTSHVVAKASGSYLHVLLCPDAASGLRPLRAGENSSQTPWDVALSTNRGQTIDLTFDPESVVEGADPRIARDLVVYRELSTGKGLFDGQVDGVGRGSPIVGDGVAHSEPICELTGNEGFVVEVIAAIPVQFQR